LRTERDYWIGNHEPLVAHLLDQLLSDGGVFYDVGVHKGYFSLIAARSLGPNGLVIGFEPNPHNLKVAQSNVDLNPDLASRIRIEHLAVSDEDGSVEFAGEPGSATGRIWEGGAGVDVLPELFAVRSICLDDFIRAGNPTPDLIKMDIEGGEVKALRGLGTALRSGAVLILEVHNEDAFAVLVDVVAEQSYRCFALDDGKALSALTGFREREQFLAYPEGHPDLEATLAQSGGLGRGVKL
jgi:FkbM family methyltransferase